MPASNTPTPIKTYLVVADIGFGSSPVFGASIGASPPGCENELPPNLFDK